MNGREVKGSLDEEPKLGLGWHERAGEQECRVGEPKRGPQVLSLQMPTTMCQISYDQDDQFYKSTTVLPSAVKAPSAIE